MFFVSIVMMFIVEFQWIEGLGRRISSELTKHTTTTKGSCIKNT